MRWFKAMIMLMSITYASLTSLEKSGYDNKKEIPSPENDASLQQSDSTNQPIAIWNLDRLLQLLEVELYGTVNEHDNDRDKSSFYETTTTTSTEKLQKKQEDDLKNGFYSFLSERLSDWYPNRDDFQRYLLNISMSSDLHNSTDAADITSNRTIFKYKITEILETPTYQREVQSTIENRIKAILIRYPYVASKQSKIIGFLGHKVKLIFLDEESLEERLQMRISMARQEIIYEFKETLENSLQKWYPTLSEFYKNLVNVPHLMMTLIIRGEDTATKKDMFEYNMIQILNEESHDLNRTNALRLRIKNLLSNQFQNFTKHHEEILKKMETKIQSEFKADLIFDDEALGSHVREAVEAIDEELLEVFRVNIESWYPINNDFQVTLLNVAKSSGFYLNSEGNKSAFEALALPILETPAYSQELATEIMEQLRSMLHEHHLEMEEIEVAVLEKFTQTIELQSQAKLLLDSNDFENTFEKAVSEAKTEAFYEFEAELDKNLFDWYPSDSGYFRNLINFTGLIWPLVLCDREAIADKDTFQSSLIDILNSESRTSNRSFALDLKIRNILLVDYATSWEQNDLVVRNMAESVQNKFKAEMIFDDNEMESYVREAVQVVEENCFFKDLWINIKTWYPEGGNFNLKLHQMAREEDFYLEQEADAIRSNKTVFEKFAELVLSRQSYEPVVAMETTKRILSFLAGPYLEMRDYEDEVIENFMKANESQDSKAKLLFNNDDFKITVETAIEDARKEIVQTNFVKFKNEFNAWLPNADAFVDKFLSFTRSRNLSLKELKKFDQDDDFMFSRDSEHFKAFADTHEVLIHTTIRNQIENVLTGIDPERVDRNFEILQVEVPEYFYQLSTVKTLKMRIGNILTPIQNCVSSFNETVEKLLRDADYDDFDELKKYLKSNACIRDEICVKTNGQKPEDELNPYIKAFIQSQSLPQSLIIKGERIAGISIKIIYIDIEKFVKERENVNREAAQCFLQYLKRINVVESIYSPSLIFDYSEMAQKIKPLQNKYQNMYRRRIIKE